MFYLSCSAKTMLVIAWRGDSYPNKPNVFAQYHCRQERYFETLKVFTGTEYEEHYIPFGADARCLIFPKISSYSFSDIRQH